MGSSKIFKSSPKIHRAPHWEMFLKMVLCSHLWSALYFVFFPLSEFNLHAASILQSILLNRLQCVLLSVPLSLYLTGCGSLVVLNHIQVSVCVDACCYGLVPTALNVKETNLTSNPCIVFTHCLAIMMQNITK